MIDDDDDEDFVNPLILKDIELIKKLHGDNCIEHKSVYDCIVCEFNL